MIKMSAVILCAGSGSRMNLGYTKQKAKILGESVLHRAVRIFNSSENVGEIIIVSKDDEVDFAKSETAEFEKVKKIVVGESTRQGSASVGFSASSAEFGYVAMHDAARCLVTHEMIDSVFYDAIKYGCATASCKVYDTIKEIDEDMNIVRTIERDSLRQVQTPQIFKRELYKKALINLQKNNLTVTDDNKMLELIGIKPHCTETGKNNIKLTVKEDLEYAEFLLSRSKNNE